MEEKKKKIMDMIAELQPYVEFTETTSLLQEDVLDSVSVLVLVQDMEEQFRELLTETVKDGLYQMILSNPREKDKAFKIKIRPVMIQGKVLFQESRLEGTKVFHENKTAARTAESVISMMGKDFKQLEVRCRGWQATALVGKKGNVTLKTRKTEEGQIPDLSHNRKKR